MYYKATTRQVDEMSAC